MNRRKFLSNTGWSCLGLAAVSSIITQCKPSSSSKSSFVAPGADASKIFFGDIHNHCNLTYGHGDMKSALVLSDLYESFSPDPTDANYARLYYIRGEYAAMRSDTLTLKRQISSLVNFSSSDETEKEKYVTALSTNLEEIRNYVPVDKTIEGTWVCDLQGNEYSTDADNLKIWDSRKPCFSYQNNDEGFRYN